VRATMSVVAVVGPLALERPADCSEWRPDLSWMGGTPPGSSAELPWTSRTDRLRIGESLRGVQSPGGTRRSTDWAAPAEASGAE